MASLNTVTNLKASIVLDGSWNTVTASGDVTKGLLIMIKQITKASENVDTNSIRAITMDIGLDSGEDNQILLVGGFTFNFSPIALTSCNSINDRAAFVKVGQLPKKFYYRISAVELSNKVIKVGDKIEGSDPTLNVKLNLEEVDF